MSEIILFDETDIRVTMHAIESYFNSECSDMLLFWKEENSVILSNNN